MCASVCGGAGACLCGGAGGMTCAATDSLIYETLSYIALRHGRSLYSLYWRCLLLYLPSFLRYTTARPLAQTISRVREMKSGQGQKMTGNTGQLMLWIALVCRGFGLRFSF